VREKIGQRRASERNLGACVESNAGQLVFSRHNVVRKYWWESPHHVIASACLRSLTQDVGRVLFSNGLAIRDLPTIPS
jgi:hypothetical protein